MTEISAYSLVILVGVAIFGAVLGILRVFHLRKLRSATGVIERLEEKGVGDLQKGEDLQVEELQKRPALYGIPYLAYIMTSLVILAAFFFLFFENLVGPYFVPEIGDRSWHAYRAPVKFEAGGQSFDRYDIIVSKGDAISSRDRRLISAAIENKGKVSGLRVLGTILLLTVFFFLLLYHLSLLYPPGMEKDRNLILIFVTILIVLACAKLALFYDLFSPYLLPIPWAGMTITILVNRRIVPLTMLITLIVVSIDSQFDFVLFLVLLAGGLVSGSWVRQARKRGELVFASLLVGAVMSLVFYCTIMLTSQSVELLDARAVATLSNGIISGLLVLIFLPLFEIVFDFASPFRLMELLDLNTAVMKEFFFKAPGTYQHSMVVANIAEAVSNEIGANGLLVRVGSYYHDIGKMFNPNFFIENQRGEENPHDELGPVASAAVVRSHVILGVRLAKQIGVPGAVVSFIPEHHGTSTIDYFYFKSKKQESEIKSEKIFKYPGPKPQSKETAIVMIVDSLEASSRVLQSRDEETTRELVDKIVSRKLEQGELDRSGLTIGELKKIKDVLVHIMTSSGHKRISYPTGVKAEDEDQKQDSKTEGKESVPRGRNEQERKKRSAS